MSGFLLQENGSYLLQESSNKILLSMPPIEDIGEGIESFNLSVYIGILDVISGEDLFALMANISIPDYAILVDTMVIRNLLNMTDSVFGLENLITALVISLSQPKEIPDYKPKIKEIC